MKEEKVIYYLTEEDVQNVAFEEIERSLLPEEIQKVIPLISEQVNWYDAIARVVNETFGSKNELW